MLPRDWYEHLEAPSGALLIRLDGIPEMKGELYLPPGFRDFTRTNVGTIVRTGYGVTFFEPGDRVMLAASMGRSFTLGEPPDEVELWRVYPSQVMLLLKPEIREGAEPGEHPFRNYKHGDQWQEPDPKLLDGDPRALR